MIPELPPNPRAELEARVTAWLLGELPADEAAAVRRKVEGDIELQKLRDRLSQTLNLLRETVATPVGETPALPKPLKLSAARREQLLAQFKTIRPKEFEKPKRGTSDLILALAAVASIALVASMLLPALAKSKSKAMRLASAPQALDEFRITSGRARNSSIQDAAETSPSASAHSVGVQGGTSASEQKGLTPADSVKTAEDLAVRRQEARITGQLRERRLAENAPAPATPPSGGIVLPQSAGAIDSEQLASLNRDGGVRTDFKSQFDNVPVTELDRHGLYDANKTEQPAPPAVVAAPAPAGAGGVVALNGNIEPQAGVSSLDGALFSADKTLQLSRPLAVEPAPVPSGESGNPSWSRSYGYDPYAVINPALSDGAVAKTPTAAGEYRLYLEDDKKQAATRSTFQQNAAKLKDQLAENEEVAPAEAAKKESGKLGWPGHSVGGRVDNEDLAGAETPAAHGGMRMLQKEYESRSRKPAAMTPLPGMEPPVATTSALAASARPAPVFMGKPTDDREKSKSELAGGNAYSAGATNGVMTYAFREPSAPVPPPVAAPATVVNNGVTSSNGWVVTQSIRGKVDLLGDVPLARPAPPAPVPQPEVLTSINAFTTFSLNVSDVAFKLAQASLQNGQMPDAASMRSEEFINAFDYRDPEPVPGAPIGFAWERAGDPFTHGRDFLRFSVKTAAQGRAAGRPLNLVLLLDKSGSMERADRVDIIARALQVLASQLRENDTLSVVVFARTARLFVDGVPGSQAGDVSKKLRDLTPEGGTNLEEAMRLAYEAAMRHYLANGENRVVLLTDGAANLGNVEPAALKRSVESNRKQGIALDCFGVGWDGYNDPMLETLSRAGNGRYGFINTPEEAATEFAGKLAGALRVAANDVKVQVEFNPDRVAAYRQIGYAKDQLKKEDFRNNAVKAAQIGVAESGNALYTIQIKASGEGPIGTVHVRYRVPGTEDYREHEWIVPYNGGSVPLDKASPAMRLAATAAEFAEMLAGNPYAAGVTPDLLLNYLRGVPQVYGADQRPTQLEWMIRQAKAISGK
jgi:uncharacterized protein YegL